MSLIIGIAGDSGAGKTSLLSFFRNLWKDKLLIIEGDAYHLWERNDPNWNEYTPLNPKANNLSKAANDLNRLKSGMSSRLRDYNHDTGKFDEDHAIDPHDYIIHAGLHALATQEMRELEDIKIFLNTDEDLRLFWKYKRDINERGYTKERVAESLKRRIADSKKYIKPQLLYADIVINIYDDNLIFDDFNYQPKLTMSIQINKNCKYVKEILHILKNINFKVTEDEKFICAQYSEQFEHFQSINI